MQKKAILLAFSRPLWVQDFMLKWLRVFTGPGPPCLPILLRSHSLALLVLEVIAKESPLTGGPDTDQGKWRT